MNATSSSTIDPFEAVKWYKYLRIADVSDAMDYIGYFGVGLMSPEIRPLWQGMRFWGPAVTIRCVPANRPMWTLKGTHSIVTEDNNLTAHREWAQVVGKHPSLNEVIHPGCVLVLDSGGSSEAGHWGSSGTLMDMKRGVVGFVTDGYCRDTYEVALHRTPICARSRGRTICEGRMEVVEIQARVGCGGVQVRPGDIVGADDDGVIVVPLEVAEEVGRYASEWVVVDNGKRRKYLEELGLPFDDTVEVGEVRAYYDRLNHAWSAHQDTLT